MCDELLGPNIQSSLIWSCWPTTLHAGNSEPHMVSQAYKVLRAPPFSSAASVQKKKSSLTSV